MLYRMGADQFTLQDQTKSGLLFTTTEFDRAVRGFLAALWSFKEIPLHEKEFFERRARDIITDYLFIASSLGRPLGGSTDRDVQLMLEQQGYTFYQRAYICAILWKARQDGGIPNAIWHPQAALQANPALKGMDVGEAVHQAVESVRSVQKTISLVILAALGIYAAAKLGLFKKLTSK